MLGQIGGGFLRSDFMHEVVAGLVVTDISPIKLAVEIHPHVLQLRGTVGREGFGRFIQCAPLVLLREKRLIIGAACQSFGLARSCC